jgi:hypothetical protein
MKVSDLIILMSNRLAWLNNAKATAVAAGDAEAVLKLDSEISETQDTLNSLQTL